MNTRNKLLPTLSRVSPAVFLILTILNCIISPSKNSFYLLIVYCSVILSNWFNKYLFVKPVYDFLHKSSLPILGIGARPKNATSCGLVLDNILATSYGMPSGHSQTAWTVATYLLYKIIKYFYYNYNNNNRINKINKIFQYIFLIGSCILVITCATYISYSRVYIEGCHTIQQVIVGGLIGIFVGFLAAYYENFAVNLLSKMY